MLYDKMLVTTTDDIEDMWYMFDTGVKMNSNTIKVRKETCNERLYEVIKTSVNRGNNLIALRENNYGLGKVTEALIAKEDLDFGMLEEDYNVTETLLVSRSVVQFEVDENDGITRPCIIIKESDECDRIYMFGTFDVVKALYGSKSLIDMTESAVQMFEIGGCPNGWIDMKFAADAAGLIATSTANELINNRYKILYTYKKYNNCYLILAMQDEKGKLMWNIMQYNQLLAKQQYLKAMAVPVCDKDFLSTVNTRLSYFCSDKIFRGLGLEITLSGAEFNMLLLNNKI